VDVPLPPDEIVTEAGLKERFSPAWETVEVSVIVPENPLRLVRVIVLLLDEEP